jgi:hypothetical protein
MPHFESEEEFFAALDNAPEAVFMPKKPSRKAASSENASVGLPEDDEPDTEYDSPAVNATDGFYDTTPTNQGALK